MLGLILTAALTTANQGISCEELTTLTIPETRISSSVTMPAGPFKWPEGAVAPPGTNKDDPVPIPAHCRVKMVLTPTTDSEINVELWLPSENWNNKFMAVGNGGWAGAISSYSDMKAALRRGYATAGTDTGHTGSMFSGMFALGHPEKVIDFADRSIHLMTVRAKQIIDAHYQRKINYSYYNGCSTGGRQGLMSAQRYPEDFDGIIAGAPANRHINMHVSSVTQIIRLLRNPAAAVTGTQAKLVNNAVLKQCDTLNEGFLNNPRECRFDFSTLQCQGEAREDCLTREQLETVLTFYNGVKNSKGELIFSGSSISNPITPKLGSDAGRSYGEGTNEMLSLFLFDTVRILGFQNPDHDWRSFDLDRDMPMIDAAAGFINAVDPDLSAYRGRGGKLLLYHGWDDPGITAENTVYYYNSVLSEMGGEQMDWMRLFLVPGMGHCRDGKGPHSFDKISALEQWREQDIAPELILGVNPESALQRPLCPYPQYARYDGTGDLRYGGNWSCAAP